MSQKSEKDKPHEGNWYILLAGLPIPSRAYTLAPGVSLRPLKNKLSIFDLAAVGAAGFREWAVLEPYAQSCTCEIESAKDADIAPGYDALNRAWLASALLLLCGFDRHLCLAGSSYSWNIIAGHQKRTAGVFHHQLLSEGPAAAVYRSQRALPQFKGALLDFHLNILSAHTTNTVLSLNDARRIYNFYPKFNKLAAESAAFRFALEAAIDWRYAKDLRAAMSRVWAGIESIFGIKSEIVYRVSLYCACLLTKPGPERKQKFYSCKQMYGVRCKAVHGEPISDDKLSKALEESSKLLSALLFHSADLGHIPSEAELDSTIF